MNRPTHVRKRDGRVVPFDEGKIADAIYRAALAVGGEDRFLAEELASVVTLFIGKLHGGPAGPAVPGDGVPPLPGMEDAAPASFGEPPVPGIEQIQDVVEKVLIETGHAKTAKAYILHRERRSRLREAAIARRESLPPTLFDDRLLLVDDPAAERCAPFAGERLTRTVAAETGLARTAVAEAVAGVEARLRESQLRRIPAPLLASLIDAELLQRGLVDDPRVRTGAHLPRAVIDAALAPKARPGAAVPPEEAARRLGGEALRAHALAAVFPATVAQAHLEGALHVHGLSRPAALFAATLSLDALKLEGVPGAGGRRPAAAAASARRFISQVGRALRQMRGFTTHGVGVPAANLLAAPVLGASADSPEALEEEAWHLLFEAAGGPDGVPVELDLWAAPEAVLAAAPARGPGGVAGDRPLGAHAAAATALARALVRVRAGADGLPPRAHLPRLTVVLGREGLAAEDGRRLLAEALAAAETGSAVRVVLQRDDDLAAGIAAARSAVTPNGRPVDPAGLRPFEVQRVTLNLPRAAYESRPGDLTAFFRTCDRLVDLAVEAHLARRSLVATVAAGDGGALAPLFRRPRSGGRRAPDPPDLHDGDYSVGVLGLNEAVAHLLGEELHESDAAVKVGARVLAYLALKVHEAGDSAGLRLALDAVESSRAAERFVACDRAEHRIDTLRAAGERRAYTPGVALRDGAPVDLLLRLDREGRLHGHLRSATFRYAPSAEDGVSPEGLRTLVEKAFLHTPVVQLAFGTDPA